MFVIYYYVSSVSNRCRDFDSISDGAHTKKQSYCASFGYIKGSFG